MKLCFNTYIGGCIMLTVFFFPQTLFGAECTCDFEINIARCAGGTMDNPRMTGGTFRHTDTFDVAEGKTKNDLHSRLRAYGETACNITGENALAQQYGAALDTPWKDNSTVIDENNCNDSVNFRSTGILTSAVCEIVISQNSNVASPPSPTTEIKNDYVGIPFSIPSTESVRVTSAQSLPELIGKGLRLFTGFFGSIALIMVIYGGLQIMTAAGQSEKIKQGGKIIAWASIGLITMMLSYLLVSFVFGAIA